MKLQKTIRIPVSNKITKEKLEKLDRLTARLTYGVQLFKNKIIENDITTVKEAEKFRKEIQQLTSLQSAFAQACRDKALWMYKSYKKLYKDWKKEIKKLEKAIENCKNKNKYKHKREKLERKLYRLRKREPSLPTINNKTPVMFDYRTGSIEFSHTGNLSCGAEYQPWRKGRKSRSIFPYILIPMPRNTSKIKTKTGRSSPFRSCGVLSLRDMKLMSSLKKR